MYSYDLFNKLKLKLFLMPSVRKSGLHIHLKLYFLKFGGDNYHYLSPNLSVKYEIIYGPGISKGLYLTNYLFKDN